MDIHEYPLLLFIGGFVIYSNYTFYFIVSILSWLFFSCFIPMTSPTFF